MSTFIVTGGAGFIGSALVWALNQRGEANIIIVDELDHDQKERNVGHLQYEQLISIKEFREKLMAGDYDAVDIKAILHMGACSDTTETDWNYLEDNNVEYSKDIIRWCADHNVRCVYASSAATYGDGQKGYQDDHVLFDQLEPLNLYGKSKLLVDIWARDAGYLKSVVGLRYFNVFGPNEGHKGQMQSVIAKRFAEVQQGKKMDLFRSYDSHYEDGEQERDFIYIKDAVAATLFFMDHPEPAGVFNIGTGKARTWNDVAAAMFRALDKTPNISYVDMPKALQKQYQYHTEANIKKLRDAGYTAPMMGLEDAITDYLQNYLVPDLHLGEERATHKARKQL